MSLINLFLRNTIRDNKIVFVNDSEGVYAVLPDSHDLMIF